jgi:hypothetical protein
VETPRTFAIRTFGCQMNEHDSERLAGLLVADGLVAAPSDAEADVVVLNTCTIRENADLKLYSALGQLKALKESRPGMQIAVGGCMAQKDRGSILERANWVDVVFGTHNLAAAPSLLRRSASEGPIDGDPRRPGPRDQSRHGAGPVRRARAGLRRVDDHSNGLRQYAAPTALCRAVRGGEISRPMDDLLAEAVHARRVGCHRDHRARPERQLVRA